MIKFISFDDESKISKLVMVTLTFVIVCLSRCKLGATMPSDLYVMKIYDVQNIPNIVSFWFYSNHAGF